MTAYAIHRHSAFSLHQSKESETPPSLITPPTMFQETREPSLLQKIWSIFCCCCSSSESVTLEPVATTSAATCNLDDLLFDTEGTGDRFHHVIHPMRKQDFLTEQEEEETLYQRLNRMDYAEVRKVLATYHPVLSQEKTEQLSSFLDEMYQSQPFLNPTSLSQKISDLPPKLIRDITEQASLAVIHATGKRLLPTNSSTTDPYTNLDKALSNCYIFTSRHKTHLLIDQYPESPQQIADCIRWGALHHYHPEFIPESMSQSHTESEDVQLDNKNSSTTEELSPTSFSYRNGFDKDSSLETLPVENSVQSQLKMYSTSFESLTDIS